MCVFIFVLFLIGVWLAVGVFSGCIKLPFTVSIENGKIVFKRRQ